eukprot:scaffold4456_cov164-Amphora_coffeaeformis.AAC.10
MDQYSKKEELLLPTAKRIFMSRISYDSSFLGIREIFASAAAVIFFYRSMVLSFVPLTRFINTIPPYSNSFIVLLQQSYHNDTLVKATDEQDKNYVTRTTRRVSFRRHLASITHTRLVPSTTSNAEFSAAFFANEFCKSFLDNGEEDAYCDGEDVIVDDAENPGMFPMD